MPADDPVIDHKAEADRLIAYHSPISAALTAERTSYSSQLIPVTAYILVACAETFLRYPAMMRTIDAALPAEEIGRRARQPGSNVNLVYLWSIANFFLTGRKVLTAMDPTLDDVEAAFTVLDFWERAALAFHGDTGVRQAWDVDGNVPIYDTEVVTRIADLATPLDAEGRALVRRFNATLVNHLFLLYFDTRVGAGDTGPYLLPGGRSLLVRDFYRLGRSDFWWSDVAADVPYDHLVAGFVLDGVEVRVTDFGTARTDPDDYLEHVVGFSLFTTDGAADEPAGLRPVPLEELPGLIGVLRRVNAQHYRNVAAMSRDEMIRCGAYVYFTFLKPFAEAAGVAAELDWTVPRDLPPMVVELLSAIQGDEIALDLQGDYYPPLP